MKNLFTLFLLFPIAVFAQTSFTISGKVAGAPDSTVVRINSAQDQSLLASGLVKGESFTITGQVAEPSLYMIAIGNAAPQHIYIENTKINVKGSVAEIHNLSIEGSASHKDFNDFKLIFSPLMSELNSIVAAINQEQDQAKKDKLMPVYESTRKKLNSEVGKFVAAKKGSFVSPFLMFVTGQVTDDFVEMDKNYQLLDEKIRNSQIGKSLSQYIDYNKVGAIGSSAIEFVQNDTAGNPIALSSFRGKYVLIDFWASWCKPCRLENPNVVNAFKKFSNKNFTVLGVSLDKEKEPWLQAIKKDELTWTQVSDLQFWNNAAAQLYHVSGIPQNFLVDPNGKIVGKNLRGADLEAKLCQLLGCN
jgi:peroxiredoxin